MMLVILWNNDVSHYVDEASNHYVQLALPPMHFCIIYVQFLHVCKRQVSIAHSIGFASCQIWHVIRGFAQQFRSCMYAYIIAIAQHVLHTYIHTRILSTFEIREINLRGSGDNYKAIHHTVLSPRVYAFLIDRLPLVVVKTGGLTPFDRV